MGLTDEKIGTKISLHMRHDYVIMQMYVFRYKNKQFVLKRDLKAIVHICKKFRNGECCFM